jgi:filamentous hemagglutinin family protein
MGHAMKHAAVVGFALACFGPALAAAAPEGEQVVSGEATFARDGNLTLITTSTPQTIVNYSSFDIGSSEVVRIDQPSATSRILNNVLSTDPTLINGTLTSNGQVWIANPVGVFFGDQAIVDVGRMVAGAGKVDAAEFVAGVEHWSELTGRVEVGAGAQIRAADSVLLVGAAVANYGNISAADGMIAMVAGGEVRLARVDGRVIVTADRALAPDPERWAIVQAGTLDAGKGSVSLTAGDAYSLAINHTGITRAREIEVAGGEGGLVSVSGSLDASDRSAGATGGQISVTGDRVGLFDAQLDASGDAGGGTIRVGGDLHGEGALPNAQRTYVDEKSGLRADAITTGDGGTIIVWSDEATRFYGSLAARGGAAGGDGGFAEISGASLESRGSIDVGASAGSVGTLLYDPKDIQIVGGTADGSDSPDTSGDQVADSLLGSVLYGEVTSEPFQIYESEIEGTNANIVLEATNSISTPDASAFNGSVDLKPDRSLTMLTSNETGDGTGGIDLAGVSFKTAGTGTITLQTGTVGGTDVQANLSVGNLTTAGGAVSLTTKDGDIAVLAITTTGATSTAGSNGGSVTITAGGTGSVTAGAIDAQGGLGTAGAGGDGGAVSIRSISGSVTTNGTIDVSGGDGQGGGRGGNGGTITIAADIDSGSAAPTTTGVNPYTISVNGDLLAMGGIGSGDADDAGALGGAGGQILVSAGMVAGGGKLTIGSSSNTVTIDASAGDGSAGGGSRHAAGTSAFSNAAVGAIRIEAHGDVTAHADLAANGGAVTSAANSPGGHGGSGGDIAVGSDRGKLDFTGTLGSLGRPGVLASGETQVVDGTAGAVVLQGHGDITVSLANTSGLDKTKGLELVETELTGVVHVTSGDGTIAADGSGAGTVHTITSLTTSATAPHFTYRLADGGDGTVDLVDAATLAVGGVTFGANGGTLANARFDSATGTELLLGRILSASSGTATDVSLAGGNLQLFATNIGVAAPTRQPLTVVGTSGTPAVELTVAGDADLVIGGTVGLVDLSQRAASGDVAIDLPNGAATPEIEISGTITDDGVTRIETSRITRVDTTASNVAFFFDLDDSSASSDEAGSGEPQLSIASGAVTLGADAGFAARGDLVLEGGAAPAIDAGGHTVVLDAGIASTLFGGQSANDALGSLIASGTNVDVANAGGLIALAAGDVGTVDAPLRTSAFGGTTLALAGAAGSGDFRVVNETGSLAIQTIHVAGVDGGQDLDVSLSQIVAAGDVALANHGRDIVFEAIEQPETPVPHVHSGGDQTYDTSPAILGGTAGSVKLGADAALVAGGSVTFSNDVDSKDATPRDLTVTATGKTTFGGNVGNTAPLDQLTVTDALFTGGVAHTVKAAGIDFGAIDGPDALALLGQGAGSRIVIRNGVGTVSPLASFSADAERIEFGTRVSNGVVVTSADWIAAGDVNLNTVNPSTSTTATIADTHGGLTIASTGNVTMGRGEKLSSAAGLVIHADGTATLGDLSATELTVDAAAIDILRRAAGQVELPDGGFVPDNGVDWVANDIVTNVVPTSAAFGGFAAPIFVLGSGGIDLGGAIPFDVIRFTPALDEIVAANFGPSDRTLDLTGLGPRAVSDARNDLPRVAPPVLPGMAARRGEEPPTPPRAVSGEEVIGALHCRTAADEPCAPPAIGDDPLASERAREIVSRYRALVASEAGRDGLVSAFAPFAAQGLEPDVLPHALASDPGLGSARARIGELAVTLAQIELLGLDAEQGERVRRAVASDFAAATGVAGLGPDPVLAAVAASGVAVLP